MKTPDYYVEYSDFNEAFEVCRILERHPDGKMAKAELLARCPEEGDAYFICRNLNALAGIENPQGFIDAIRSIIDTRGRAVTTQDLFEVLTAVERLKRFITQ